MSGSYILITACRNEAAYLANCMQSVKQQSHLPLRWIIADDGSDDGSYEIAQRSAADSAFIEVKQTLRDGRRSFGAQYRAISSAYAQYRNVPHDFVSFLDADTALEGPNYFQHLLAEFERDPLLGVAGGYLLEPGLGGMRIAPGNAPWTVAGGVQTFRRDVFESINGYEPLELGGSDTLAEIRARMLGWRTVSFPHVRAFHFRPPSSADGLLGGLIKGGRMDASFGYHPLYAFAKFLRRLPQRPYVIGSVTRFAGYCAAHLAGQPLTVTTDVASFVRREQVRRLGDLLPHFLRDRAATPTEPLPRCRASPPLP